MKKYMTRKKAVCFAVIPLLMMAVLFLLVGLRVLDPYRRVKDLEWLILTIPGGLYTACLLVHLMGERAGEEAVKPGFFTLWPVLLLGGFVLFIPLYLWNGFCLAKGDYSAAAGG